MKSEPNKAGSNDRAAKGFRVELLLDRLEQTARWCDARVDPERPAECLRTLDYCRDPFVDRHLLVHWLARARAGSIGEEDGGDKASLSTPSSGASERGVELGGRILAFFPDVNLYHGLEAAESGGYLDENNNPPHDTWLAYADGLDEATGFDGGCLLSWVPRAFVAAVQAAIRVNPEGCLVWLADIDCPLTRELNGRMAAI